MLEFSTVHYVNDSFREEHLTRHTLSTHNKLKPFTCGICSRPFSRRDLLLRHAKNLHKEVKLPSVGLERAINTATKIMTVKWFRFQY